MEWERHRRKRSSTMQRVRSVRWVVMQLVNSDIRSAMWCAESCSREVSARSHSLQTRASDDDTTES